MKITVNDLNIEIELKKSDTDKFEVNVKNHTYKVEVLNITQNQITLSINNKIFTFDFTLNSDSIILTNSIHNYHCKIIGKYQNLIDTYRSTLPGESKREKILKSPMPGLITKIFVKPGAKIKVGDKLLILEAMKMENEIRSDIDGTIDEVLVKEGIAVEKGTALLKISTN